MSNASNFGTTAQEEYAKKLATKAGFVSLEAACEAHSGRPSVILSVTPYTKDQATAVITWLEKKTGVPARATKPSSADGGTNGHTNGHANGQGNEDAGKPRSRFLTARHLRLIATHQEAAPPELDEDARWVLARLHRLDAIEAFVRRGSSDQRLAVNGNDPIKVAQLVEYFGTEEAVADAFAVSLQTVRAWGPVLPPVHGFRAEVLTNGFVHVPRS